MKNNNKLLQFCSKSSIEAVFQKFNSQKCGLDNNSVEMNREMYGENIISKGKEESKLKRFADAFINPFSIILFFLAFISIITDIIIPAATLRHNEINPTTVIIIITMILISGFLRFFEESKSSDAIKALLDMITTTCTLIRDGKESEVPLDEVVVGDIVKLSAGDIIPADLRIIENHDFFVSQSSLSGESDPIEKFSAENEEDTPVVTDIDNIVFMGSNVVSGSAEGIVISVGEDTIFGNMATELKSDEYVSESSFSKGVNEVSKVLIKFMMVMVPIVFVINGVTKSDWIGALLFAVSVAVGLTPEMLPMIVTTCLAKGAVTMSKKKTVVKNLDSIQDFGAIDILCTDKTGTLTQDNVALEYHMDVEGNENNRVLRHAYLNSYFQTGYKNLIDKAIIRKTSEEELKDDKLENLSEKYIKVDEIPFDFNRRRLSVVVEDKTGKTQMVTKGAVEEILNICTHVEYRGNVEILCDELKKKIIKTVDHFNENGMRVIAVAQKNNPPKIGELKIEDEKEMVLIGYLAFLDPPKDSTEDAVRALKTHGVDIKILTGDNEKVTRYVCNKVGISTETIVLGSEIDDLSDKELGILAEKANIFAKLSPQQKSRVVNCLKERDHVVGFMGDGINDAIAMKTADIGISVDTAVDIAKESADVVLLEKDLMVLEEGILEGRRTYANMIKYIKMTASSNFGNMFSVLVASALLPFLPMMSVQLIFLNLVYDITCASIPWDNVDEEYLRKPRKWDASSIGSFMIWLGPVSSIFDWITYAFLYFIVCPLFVSNGVLYNSLAGSFSGNELEILKHSYAAVFQTGWFIQSMWSQTMVIHMIRTEKIPFIESRASKAVTLFTFVSIFIMTVIPFTAFGSMLGFTRLPLNYFLFLIPCTLLYMILTTFVKNMYIRKKGELL